MNEKNMQAFETGKTVAIWLGGAVYVGVVLLFLAFYQNLMADQFTGFLQIIARVGAVLVALNALALPVALHFWTTTKGHRIAAVIFYTGDIILMALNVLAASSANSANAPEWLVSYSTYAPASVVFTLLGWAILYMTDPGQQALVSMSESMTKAQVSIVNRVTEYINSDEGTEKIVEPFAAKLAGKVFNERTLIGSARSLPTVTEDGMAELVKQVVTAMRAENGEAGQPDDPFGKGEQKK